MSAMTPPLVAGRAEVLQIPLKLSGLGGCLTAAAWLVDACAQEAATATTPGAQNAHRAFVSPTRTPLTYNSHRRLGKPPPQLAGFSGRRPDGSDPSGIRDGLFAGQSLVYVVEITDAVYAGKDDKTERVQLMDRRVERCEVPGGPYLDGRKLVDLGP